MTRGQKTEGRYLKSECGPGVVLLEAELPSSLKLRRDIMPRHTMRKWEKSLRKVMVAISKGV